jgi:hypothetical protein
MNTVKGLSRLLDKAKNKNNPNFQQKREWLTKLTRAMNEQYTFNNLEQAFHGSVPAPVLKIEAPTRINIPLDRTRKYKMPAPTNGNFPTLFGKSKNGKTQIWQIEVIKQDPAAVIRVTYGYEGGKQVVNEKEITKGKNLGKKNETSPYEQAQWWCKTDCR